MHNHKVRKKKRDGERTMTKQTSHTKQSPHEHRKKLQQRNRLGTVSRCTTGVGLGLKTTALARTSLSPNDKINNTHTNQPTREHRKTATYDSPWNSKEIYYLGGVGPFWDFPRVADTRRLHGICSLSFLLAVSRVGCVPWLWHFLSTFAYICAQGD